jgi:hypothetical protein
MATTAACYSRCGLAWAACYAAAGLVAGTVTGGIGAPAAVIACNAAEGTCMTAYVGAAAVDVAGGVALGAMAGPVGVGLAVCFSVGAYFKNKNKKRENDEQSGAQK